MNPPSVWTPPRVSAVVPAAAEWGPPDAEFAAQNGSWAAILVLDTTTGVLTVEPNRGQYPGMGPGHQKHHASATAEAINFTLNTGWRRLAWTAPPRLYSHDMATTLMEAATPIVVELVQTLRPLPGDTTWDWTGPAAAAAQRLASLAYSDLSPSHLGFAHNRECPWIVDMHHALTAIPEMADPAWAVADNSTLDAAATLFPMLRLARFWRTALHDAFPIPRGLPPEHDLVGARSALRMWRNDHRGRVVPVGAATPPATMACENHPGDRADPVYMTVDAPADELHSLAKDCLDMSLTVLNASDGATARMWQYQADRLIPRLRKLGFTHHIRPER